MATPGSPEDFVMKILCGGTGMGEVLGLGLGLAVYTGALGKPNPTIGLFAMSVGVAGLAAKFVFNMCGKVDFLSRS